MTLAEYVDGLVLLKRPDNSWVLITPQALLARSKMDPDTLRILEQTEQDMSDTVFRALTIDSKIPYTEESTCIKQPVK